MRVVAIVQARLTSTRLPGKVLLPIGPCEALWHTIVRTRLAVPETIVAIPDTPANNPLAVWLSEKDVPYWRGPEEDVLLRYQQAAEWAKADVIVRITGDCPFVDPFLVTHAIRTYEKEWSGPYLSNTIVRILPRGLDVEVFAQPLLVLANKLATSPHDREHVTPWMRPAVTQAHVDAVAGIDDLSAHRWVLDTPEDYEWFQRIAAATDCTPPHPAANELYHLIAAHPELAHYEPTYRRGGLVNRYFARADTWFDYGTEVEMLADCGTWGVFCGLHGGEVDEESCPFGEFDVLHPSDTLTT